MIGAAIRKDALLLVRDRGALISLFALPVVFMLIFGAMFQADPVVSRTIATWHEPDDPRGVALDRAIDQTEGLVRLPQPRADAVMAWVQSKRADAGVILRADTIDQPPHSLGGSAVTLGNPCRGTRPGGAPRQGFPRVTGAIDIVVYSGLATQARAPFEAALKELVVRTLVPADVQLPRVNVVGVPRVSQPTERLSSFQISVPGNAVLFGFFLALTVAMSFASERRTGTWQRLLAAPVRSWHALAAMLVPYGVIGVAQLAFFFALGIFVFGMAVSGAVAALIAVSLALVLCAVALGLLFAAVGGTERQIAGLGSVALLVMGMLGGCMVPRQVMPPFMKSLGLTVPHGWALDAYHKVLVTPDTSIGDVVPELAALLLFASGFAGIGLTLFRLERV